MKNILFILLGMVIMYFVLTMLSNKKSSGSDDTSKLFLDLAVTPESKELVKSKQFKDVVKTDEFKKLFSSLSGDYLQGLADSMLK